MAPLSSHIKGNVVAYIALFFALSGGAAWATHPRGANTIDSVDIIDGQVMRPDLALKAVGASQLDPAAFFAEDIRPSATGLFEVPDNAIEGHEVAKGTLSGRNVADESLTGDDVQNDSLTGRDIDESTLRYACQDGIVRGFARVKGMPTMPNSYTTSSTYFVSSHNCSGRAIEIRRAARGYYLVRFVNSGATAGVASSDGLFGLNLTSLGTDIENDNDNFVAVTWRNSPAADFGSFSVSIHDADSGDQEDGAFSIMVF